MLITLSRWRILLPSLALAAAGPRLLVAQSPAAMPPNIIVFVGDDLGRRELGADGNKSIRTPNIDQLAQSGLWVKYASGTGMTASTSGPLALRASS